MIFLMIFIAACTALSILMSVRNEWVYRNRMRLIDESLDQYDSLPSYNQMFIKFWIWDVNKFLELQHSNHN